MEQNGKPTRNQHFSPASLPASQPGWRRQIIGKLENPKGNSKKLKKLKQNEQPIRNQHFRPASLPASQPGWRPEIIGKIENPKEN